MLKIKDNVDLKELEKFGFMYIEDKRGPEGDFSYCETPIGGNTMLGVSAHSKLLVVDVMLEEDSITYIFSNGLDVIFDLIKAGLVEKVEE